MSSQGRRERERIDTRRKILDAARALFVRNGYRATTMRAVADRIDYTTTAIYHHFRSKEALLTELTAQDFRALAKVFRETAQVTDPIEQLRQIGRAYIEFGVTHPMHYQLMFMTPPHVDGTKTGIKQGDPGEDAYAFLVQSCERASAAGRFRPELKDPHQVAQILWAGCHGLVSLRIAKQRDQWVEWRDIRKTAAELHNVMLHGLLRPGNS